MGGIGFWLGILVGGAIVTVMVIVALARKANARTARPTARNITVTTALAPDAAFAKLARAPLGRFRLGDSDPERNVLVFVSSITGFSWGFFFPVFIRPGSGGPASGGPAPGGSAIETGIASRAFQWGSLVTKSHKEFVAEVEKALAAR